jgi:hypothetical protein
MVRRRHCGLLLGALALCATTRAAAQQLTQSEGDSAAYEEARKRFDEGKRLIREGRRDNSPTKLEMAYVAFKEAHSLYPHAKAAMLNLVETEVVTGRVVDAMRHLRVFVREHGTPEGSEYAKAFRQHWDKAYQATGHVEISAPLGMHLFIDKDEAGSAPLATAVDVAAGHHMVEGRGPQTLRTEVDAPAGAVSRVSFDAGPSPEPAVPPAPVATAPIAAPAAPRPPPLPAPLPDPPVRDETTPKTFWTPTRTWGVVLGGAGVVAIGAGTVFAMQNKDDADRANALSAQLGPTGCASASAPASTCADLQSARSDQSRDFALAATFVGVGVAAVGTAAVLFLWPAGQHSAVAISPMFSPHGGGLQVRGDL